MPYDKFLIGPFTTGWQNNLVKWLLPEDAWQELKNMYVWRGRLKKRFGGILMGSTAGSPETQQLKSRFRADIDTTDGAGAAAGNVPAGFGPFAIGMAFSIGDEIYTVYQAAGALYSTGAGSGTFDTATGAYTFVGAPAAASVYFYPAKPVMGLTNFFQGAINNNPAIGFDTVASYQFDGTAWERIGGVFWQGNETDFFWSANWIGVNANDVLLFTTNFNWTPGVAATDDPMRYWNGTAWATFFPYFAPTGGANTGPRIAQARIIVPFQNRLLLLNVVEQDNGATTNTQFVNRVRYSKRGSPLDDNSFYQGRSTDGTNVADGASFLDASTTEEILSVGFIKNRLIVYFEESTWEIVYTANEAAPFRWQKINTDLGSQSTFSAVNFDKQLLAVGNTGFHACNGANVGRIDEKIPDEIFTINDYQTGTKRVHGIRDYQKEVVYWTFPRNAGRNPHHDYPNAIFLYNYVNGSWALNDDTITAFGYFQQDFDVTWESEGASQWKYHTSSWISGLIKTGVRHIIAGNQEGFVFVIDTDNGGVNAPVLQITNITLTSAFIAVLDVRNHNLNFPEFIQVLFTVGMTNFNDRIFQIQEVTATTITIMDPDGNFSGTYAGGGLLRRVSNPCAFSKEWNPYVKDDRNVYIERINFGLSKTPTGAFTLDYYTSSSNASAREGAELSGAALGDNSITTAPYDLYPYEKTQDTLWHPGYLQAGGENVSIKIFLTDEQMVDPEKSLVDLEIQGMILLTQATSARLE